MVIQATPQVAHLIQHYCSVIHVHMEYTVRTKQNYSR